MMDNILNLAKLIGNRYLPIMRFEDRLSYAEIAERLHIKEVSCRSRLVRAKAHFAELQQKEKIL